MGLDFHITGASGAQQCGGQGTGGRSESGTVRGRQGQQAGRGQEAARGAGNSQGTEVYWLCACPWPSPCPFMPPDPSRPLTVSCARLFPGCPLPFHCLPLPPACLLPPACRLAPAPWPLTAPCTLTVPCPLTSVPWLSPATLAASWPLAACCP